MAEAMIIIDGETVDRPRLHSLTERVESKFGAMYCLCSYDDLGRVHGIHIEYKTKHMDSAVGDALDGLNEAIRKLIHDARGDLDAAR